MQQVREDHALLRSKVSQLRGPAGAARFDGALTAAREEEIAHANAVAAAGTAAAAANGRPPTPQVATVVDLLGRSGYFFL